MTDISFLNQDPFEIADTRAKRLRDEYPGFDQQASLALARARRLSTAAALAVGAIALRFRQEILNRGLDESMNGLVEPSIWATLFLGFGSVAAFWILMALIQGDLLTDSPTSILVPSTATKSFTRVSFDEISDSTWTNIQALRDGNIIELYQAGSRKTPTDATENRILELYEVYRKGDRMRFGSRPDDKPDLVTYVPSDSAWDNLTIKVRSRSQKQEVELLSPDSINSAVQTDGSFTISALTLAFVDPIEIEAAAASSTDVVSMNAEDAFVLLPQGSGESTALATPEAERRNNSASQRRRLLTGLSVVITALVALIYNKEIFNITSEGENVQFIQSNGIGVFSLIYVPAFIIITGQAVIFSAAAAGFLVDAFLYF